MRTSIRDMLAVAIGLVALALYIAGGPSIWLGITLAALICYAASRAITRRG